MKTNSTLQFNLGTFNIPTVVGLLTIIGMVWSQSASRAKIDANVEFRLTSIEQARAAARTDMMSSMNAMNQQITVIPNLVFRVQNLEAANTATNARIDRQTDAIGDLREGINNVGTKLEVLTQRIEIAVPLKRSDLTEPPKEYIR